MTGRSALWKRTVKTSAGRSFGALVREEAAAIYDKVLYVDIRRGSDAADGESWDSPLYSINGAMAKLYGGDTTSETYARNRSAFAVIFRCYNTGDDTYHTQQIINVNSVHLIGAGAWYGAGAQYSAAFLVDGNYLTQDTDLTGLRSTYAGLDVKADDVVIQGIQFILRRSSNNPYMLAFSDKLNSTDTGHANRGCGVFDCAFEGDSGGSGTHYGLGLCGPEAARVIGNDFRFHTEGVTIGEGPIRYAHDCVLKDNVYSGCAYGIRANGLGTGVFQNFLDHETVLQRASSPTMGQSLVVGFDLTKAAYNYARDCAVNALKANSYAPGTSNFWTRCWHHQSGAAAVAVEYDGG